MKEIPTQTFLLFSDSATQQVTAPLIKESERVNQC